MNRRDGPQTISGGRKFPLAANNHIGIEDYRHLSIGGFSAFRAFCRSRRQVFASFAGKWTSPSASAKIAARTDILAVRHQTGNRRAILEQNERHALIAHAVYAFRKIAGRFGDRDGGCFHVIRLCRNTTRYAAFQNAADMRSKNYAPATRFQDAEIEVSGPCSAHPHQKPSGSA